MAIRALITPPPFPAIYRPGYWRRAAAYLRVGVLPPLPRPFGRLLGR